MGDSRPTQKTTYSQATLRAEPKDCNKRSGSYPTRIPTQKVFSQKRRITKKILAKNIQFDNKAVNTKLWVKHTSIKNIIILFRKLENLKTSQISNQLEIGGQLNKISTPKNTKKTEIPNEISLQDKNIGLTNNNLDTPENQMGVDSINQEINLSKDSGINTPEAEMKIQTRSRKQAIPETQTNRLEARQ
ncbi:hypothetical protein BB558_007476 [Smittium angustum]|uniref:Uncharacterized protein n=1 Tax=Smittium angustum TaxID=133377 RepID=A0A2U1IUV8_SMIAN|nr:hypothetical protein BB558_007476 [Smittium angustum]